MPKINRIRIANVSWERRIILDELYDSYDGEDILLNLVNGGGKSVLVQMMLQPILPTRRIRKRKIDDYLSKTSAPTYIMVEWKLDNTARPFYLLTGIAMCSIGQSGEQASRTKYFTFINYYDEANAYDIRHIPLITHRDGEVTYLPYEAARSQLKQAKGDSFQLRCFAFDESDTYRTALRQYGILPEEWELIADINDKEGGVDELFAACKTSDSLMDRWILKTVAEELSQGNTELTELFLALMSSILDKEEKLREKELLESFAGETNAFIATIANLCGGLETAEKMAGELAGLHGYLEWRQRETEREKAALAAQETGQKEKLVTIQREEISEKYLRCEEDCRTRQIFWQQAQTAWDGAKRQREQARNERECLEAAHYATELRTARQTRQSLNEQLELLRTGHADEDLQRVAYTLWRLYDEAIQKYGEDLTALQRQVTEDAAALRQAEQREKELDVRLARDRQETGSLNERISSFSAYEEATLRELSLSLDRNLVGELPPTAIAQAKAELQKRRDAGQMEKARLNKMVDENRQRLAAQQGEQEALAQRREAAGIAVAQRQQALAAFATAEARRQEILARHGLPPARLYDHAYCQNALRQAGAARQHELEGAQRRLLTARETLRDCESGNLHTARRFGELLAQAGIMYDTGETYLRRLGPEEQDACLRANPMLPFCFLVVKDDLRRLPAPAGDEALNRVCPVMAFEDVAVPWHAAGRTVDIPPALRLACLYNGQSLRAETDYAALLRQEIERQTAVAKHLREQRAQIEADLRALQDDFPYTAESRRELDRAKTDAERAYRDILRRMDELKAAIDQTIHEAAALAASQRANETEIEKAQRHDQRFAEFLTRDAQYVAALRRRRELADEIASIDAELTENRKLCRELTSRLAENKGESARLQRDRDDLTKRRAALGSPSPAEPLRGSLPVLEERYRDIISQRNKNEQLLLARIGDAAKAATAAEKSLRRYAHLPPADYEGLPFSDEALARASERERAANEAAVTAQNRQAEAQGVYTAAQARLEDARKDLAAAGLAKPLPPEQIFRDYARRRQEIKESLARLAEEQAECGKTLQELDKRAHRILQYVTPGEIPSLAAPLQGAWDDIDIPELGNAYREACKANEKAQQALWYNLQALRGKYADKHPILSQYLRNIPLEETAATYDAYYFVYERMTDQSARLQDTITVLAADLAHLETDKKNIVRHALIQGRNLYEGLRKLSNGSFVKIWLNSPPRQTLKIGVPDTLDGGEEERMTSYVETCIATLRAEKTAGTLTEETLRKKVGHLFADRELLCQVLNTAHIPVSLYKVDQIPANSGLRSWEDVLVENSGGEFFVSCFVLVSALMSYRRDSIMGKSGVTDTTRVFLIDNPFGKTSSKHLLEAMLQVAKKFKTQMICLSDLSQSSITNRFALIYQLSVRQALYSRNSYLRTDEVRRNGDVHQNERLEHVVLNTPPGQMDLFQEQPLRSAAATATTP